MSTHLWARDTLLKHTTTLGSHQETEAQNCFHQWSSCTVLMIWTASCHPPPQLAVSLQSNCSLLVIQVNLGLSSWLSNSTAPCAFLLICPYYQKRKWLNPFQHQLLGPVVYKHEMSSMAALPHFKQQNKLTWRRLPHLDKNMKQNISNNPSSNLFISIYMPNNIYPLLIFTRQVWILLGCHGLKRKTETERLSPLLKFTELEMSKARLLAKLYLISVKNTTSRVYNGGCRDTLLFSASSLQQVP